MNSTRVSVFIDNSNVFHNLLKLNLVGLKWATFYNPLVLAQKIAGGRTLKDVYFYCAPPPQYLLDEPDTAWKYKKTSRYYSAVEKLDHVTLKLATLQGAKGSITEKNLDTQLATDMVAMAALNEYDVAVLVSNDGDYQSTVQTIRERFHKRVEVLFFRGSLSMALRKACDQTRRARPSLFERMDSRLIDSEEDPKG
jgi:uncharacterized LabA/DUF88 family protein